MWSSPGRRHLAISEGVTDLLVMCFSVGRFRWKTCHDMSDFYDELLSFTLRLTLCLQKRVRIWCKIWPSMLNDFSSGAKPPKCVLLPSKTSSSFQPQSESVFLVIIPMVLCALAIFSACVQSLPHSCFKKQTIKKEPSKQNKPRVNRNTWLCFEFLKQFCKGYQKSRFLSVNFKGKTDLS